MITIKPTSRNEFLEQNQMVIYTALQNFSSMEMALMYSEFS